VPARARNGETMSESELGKASRQVIDIAREARTPSDAHRDRAYQALLAGLSGGAAVGLASAAKAAGGTVVKSSLWWLKWALPAVVAASAGLGAYAGSARGPSAAPARENGAFVGPTKPLTPSVAPTPRPSPTLEPPPSAALSSPAAGVKPPALKPAANDLVQELSLLHQALAASRAGNAAQALELSRQHARRFPDSRLASERSAIEVRSLCSLGRTAEARKVAERLRSRAAGSPVIAALADTCVGK
jgi:hypothetical protein